jgi:hypothetical protein
MGADAGQVVAISNAIDGDALHAAEQQSEGPASRAYEAFVM